MEKNKGMRAIAKIMLNSLWGKLAQRENMTKTEYFSEASLFFDLVTNPTRLSRMWTFAETWRIQNPMWRLMLAVM